MNEICECTEPGYCSRRKCRVARGHWQNCRNGSVLAMDSLYQQTMMQDSSAGHDTGPVSGIGSQLERIIERETGEHVPCSDCRNEILRLNRMTEVQVVADRDRIIDGIVNRGRSTLGWWNPKRWAIELAPSQVTTRVEKWLDEAILNARNFCEQQPLVEFNEVPQRGRLTAEEIRIARGLATGVSRATVLRKRKEWRDQGIELPPLQDRSPADPLRPQHSRASRTAADGARVKSRHWAGAFTRTCIHLGSLAGSTGCSCSSSQEISLFECNHEHGPDRCCLTNRDLGMIRDQSLKGRVQSCEGCSLRIDVPRFVTNQQYMQDVSGLAAIVPSDVTTIAGIARSGLCAATMISMLLHLPMDVIRQQQGDVVSGGNGWRLQNGQPMNTGGVFVVDDTCMTGNSLRSVRSVVEQHYAGRRIHFGTVYVNPLATSKPDVWAVDLPWPHLLEWNLFNSVLLPACAMDFDGILCDDCGPGDDDDGPRYEQFLRQTRPKYVVRKQSIPLIVTARLEKYRKLTMKWLDSWGIAVQQLQMGPWQTLHERARSDIAAFKAEHYGKFMKQRVRPGPHLFIESDPSQAKRIAKLSGGIVVCPAAGCCFT